MLKWVIVIIHETLCSVVVNSHQPNSCSFHTSKQNFPQISDAIKANTPEWAATEYLSLQYALYCMAFLLFPLVFPRSLDETESHNSHFIIGLYLFFFADIWCYQGKHPRLSSHRIPQPAIRALLHGLCVCTGWRFLPRDVNLCGARSKECGARMSRWVYLVGK